MRFLIVELIKIKRLKRILIYISTLNWLVTVLLSKGI